jgi:hypothetical protein
MISLEMSAHRAGSDGNVERKRGERVTAATGRRNTNKKGGTDRGAAQ